MNFSLSEWLAGQSLCWLNDCLTDWMTLSATELLVHGLTVDWMTAWLTGLQTICWLNDCLTDWMTLSATELLVHGLTVFDCKTSWLNHLFDWMFGLQTNCLSTKWPHVWLNYRLTDSGRLTVLWADTLFSQWPTDRPNERLANWMSGLLKEWL